MQRRIAVFVTRRAVLQVRMPRLRLRIGVQADETGLRMREPEKIQRAFPFIKVNDRQAKPRSRGVTEIRGPYYTPMGKHYLQDVLQTMGKYVDALKFAGGSFALMPRDEVKELIDLCHAHEVLVSTGGFIERVLAQGQQAVEAYIEECKKLGFDIIEISSGFISIPADDWLRLVENVKTWRTEVPAKIANTLGLEKVMFEAADPEVLAWYIKNYGPEVNLFVDHSQIVQLECLRSGIWGTASLWGRVVTYKNEGLDGKRVLLEGDKPLTER